MRLFWIIWVGLKSDDKCPCKNTHRREEGCFLFLFFDWDPFSALGSNPGNCTAVVVTSPWSALACDSFPVSPGLSWPWWCRAVMARCFVDCPPVGLFTTFLTIRWLDWVMSPGEERPEVLCPRASHHKWCIHLRDSSLLIPVHLDHFDKVAFSGFLHY